MCSAFGNATFSVGRRLRVVLRLLCPLPRARDDFFERAFRFPVEQFLSAGWISHEFGGISCPPRPDVSGDLTSGSALHRCHYLLHRVSLTGAEIQRGRIGLREILKSEHVGFGE